MGININNRTDYSMLFGNLGGNDSAAGGLNLADYASIKNGSYGKLLKAYYTKDSEGGKPGSKDSGDKDSVAALDRIATTAKSVQDAASQLNAKGSKSLFNKVDKTVTDENGKKSTVSDYDTDKIYSAVSDFVKGYNSFINNAKKSDNANVAREADSLANMVTVNFRALAGVGITINDDDSMSLDENKFRNTDMNRVKNVFNGTQSLAYQIAGKTSMVGTTAASAAKSAKGYTSSGSYNEAPSAGSMLNSIV